MAHKASNIYYLAFYKQSLLFPVVEPSPAHGRELLELFSFSPFSLSKVEKKGWRRIGKREANCLHLMETQIGIDLESRTET